MSSGTGPQRGLFNVPVDPQKLGIPDYFKRVPEPMDLVSPVPVGQSGGVVSFVLVGGPVLLVCRHRQVLLLAEEGGCAWSLLFMGGVLAVVRKDTRAHPFQQSGSLRRLVFPQSSFLVTGCRCSQPACQPP